MVTPALTDEMIQSGRALIEDLDGSGLHVDVAMWMLFPDISAWKLMISSPVLIADGPKAAYDVVQKSLARISPRQLKLDDIVIAKAEAPLLRLMRVAVRTKDRTLASIRFTNNVINGQLIPDALIYRLS